MIILYMCSHFKKPSIHIITSHSSPIPQVFLTFLPCLEIQSKKLCLFSISSLTLAAFPACYLHLLCCHKYLHKGSTFFENQGPLSRDAK